MAQHLSTNDFCARLARQRRTAEAKGQILMLPRTATVVVPFEHNGYGWLAAVVGSTADHAAGGPNLWVADIEIETALQLYPHETVVADAARLLAALPVRA